MRTRRILIASALVLSLHNIRVMSFPQEIEKRVYITKHVNPGPPVIDGRLDDPCWEEIEWASGFVQYIPNEGIKATQETAFGILYDDKNIYVGLRMYDTEPERIVRRMGRRDNYQGDDINFIVDSYFDKRTCFAFAVNAAGVKWDGVISEDGYQEDTNWDPVWFVKTVVDEKGWCAEMQIPMTQIRFGNLEKHIWGMQINRGLYREQEFSSWQLIPRSASGWVSRFGELHGIQGIHPRHQFELLPYGVEKYQQFEKEDGNPFADGRENDLLAGLDGKIGVTNDMTLDFTINPDFGQVEADPSEVNLTAFESFFSEKRPFFIEGSNLFDYRITSDGSSAMDRQFYSRRIGRAPHGWPSVGAGEYADVPDQTTILGAFKLTGKTRNGLSIGVLESVTAEESALISDGGPEEKQVVEPLTQYLAARLQQDWNGGNTILGGMVTAVNRNLDDPGMKFLHRAAYTGGFDFTHFWKDKTYYFTSKTVFSHVLGDPEAILQTQTSSPHYFQRGDDYVSVDSSATSMSGTGGSIELGIGGNSRFIANTSFSWRSPGLEMNDVGYQRVADYSVLRLQTGYRIFDPVWIFRELDVDFAYWINFLFDHKISGHGGFLGFFLRFLNMWSINGMLMRENEAVDIAALRGGPSILQPGFWRGGAGISTDPRRKAILALNFHSGWGDDDVMRSQSISMSGTWRPINALELQFSPSWSYNEQELQYVASTGMNEDPRYILAGLEQTTASLTMRLTVNLTPEFTIQYYGQPFVSAGTYSRFKRVTDPRAEKFGDRFHAFSDAETAYDESSHSYAVDEDLDGTADYGFANPDFNFQQFRSNLVLRWEYSPGSILYLVWSQQRTGFAPDGSFVLDRDFRTLFDIFPHDVFLIKFTKWFSW